MSKSGVDSGKGLGGKVSSMGKTKASVAGPIAKKQVAGPVVKAKALGGKVGSFGKTKASLPGRGMVKP